MSTISGRPRTLRERLAPVVAPYGGGDTPLVSLIFDVFIIGCILGSCVIAMLEWRFPEYKSVLAPIELALTAVFIIEYGLRWYAAPSRWRYPFQFLSIVDFIAILPSLLLIICETVFARELRGLRVLRLLRLVRLMRLMRLVRFVGLFYRGVVLARVHLSAAAYRYRARPLAVLLLWTAVIWVLGANALYFTEAAFGVTSGPFSDYFESYWNVVIVIISGIEDKEPVSLLGRIEITTMLVAGVVFVGFITGEIVSVLIQKWQRGGLVALMPPRARLENHIVVLGVNGHLQNVVQEINAALEGTHFFLIVDEKADQIAAFDTELQRRVFALVGDPSQKQVLDRACIDDAARIVVLSSGDDGDSPRDRDNRSLMMTLAATLRERDQSIPTVVEIADRDNLSYAHNLPSVDFVVGQPYGEQIIVQAILHPGTTELFDDLLNFNLTTNEIYLLRCPRHLVGKRMAEARRALLDFEKAPLTLIGVRSRTADGAFAVKWAASPDGGAVSGRLNDTDDLIVLAYTRPKLGRAPREAWRTTHLEQV